MRRARSINLLTAIRSWKKLRLPRLDTVEGAQIAAGLQLAALPLLELAEMWKRIEMAVAYVLSFVGWVWFVADNPSVLMQVGLCVCGHREMHHANDDSRECLVCEPASKCPRFFPVSPPKKYEVA